LVELIIVDGGSKNNTLSIVREFIDRYGGLFNNVRLIVHDMNYGVSRARNDGLKVARGDYILILDHDVNMNENTLRTLYDYLSVAPQKVAEAIPLHINVCGGLLERWFERIAYGRIMKTNAVTSCCLIRRNVIERVGYYDETLGPPLTVYEDIEYGARVMSKGYEIHLLGYHNVIHYTCEDQVLSVEIKVGAVSRLKKLLLNLLRKVKDVHQCSYYFALKMYVRSLPQTSKLMWYICSTLGILGLTLLILAAVYSSIVLIIPFLMLTLISFIDVLRDYWNPKVLFHSLMYSVIAFVWRIIRASTLLLNSWKRHNARPRRDWR